MTDNISFDDFVNQQIAKEEPPIDWIQVRDDWKKHLDEFYQLAEGFLQKYIDQGKVRITTATKQITEEHIGSYDVKSLEVQIGTVKVCLDPIGTLIVGAKGRVDMRREGMYGPYGTVKFVLVPKTALPLRSASSFEIHLVKQRMNRNLLWRSGHGKDVRHLRTSNTSNLKRSPFFPQ